METRTKSLVGLYFGSFNPIHIGHLIIANHVVEFTDINELWFVVSPHNPLKSKSGLAKDNDRYYLVQLAIENNPKFRASNIEFGLPKPSYTIDTLTYLAEKYPLKQFKLIMGGDNLKTIEKWKNYEQLIAKYQIIVYSRPGYDFGAYADHPNITILDNVPMMDISATFIRDSIKKNKSIQYLVPDTVYKYINGSNMYK